MHHGTAVPPRAMPIWRPTITYFLMFVGIGMMGGILGPALPFLAERSGSSMSQIAMLFTSRALGNMFGSVISGHMLDRYRGHWVLVGMLILSGVGMMLMPVSPLLVIMILVVFGMGFSEVSINTGCNVMFMWLHRERAGPFISALHFNFSLGSMLVPLLVMLAINNGVSVLWAFWLVAFFMLTLAVVLAPQPSPKSPAQDGSDFVDKVYDKVVFVALLTLFGLYVGAEITFVGWITTYGVLTGMAQGDAAFLVSVLWFSLAGGRLLAIPILRRGYYAQLLYGCLALGVFSMLALYFSWFHLTGITFLFGLALSAIFPTLFTLGNELVSLNGKRTGLIFLSTGIGAILAPTITGPLIDNLGTRALPVVLLVLLGIIALGLAFILLRQKHNRAANAQ